MPNPVFPIIGMSPGNSYFKDDAVRFLLSECKKRFGTMAVLIPDIPAILTYKALGYSDAQARTKAIAKGNNLRNRVHRVATALGLLQDDVRIVDWTVVESDPTYRGSLEKLLRLFKEQPSFRSAAMRTTEQVLRNSHKSDRVVDSAIELACGYLLAELAFMEGAPAYFGKATLTYVYHNPWPVYEQFIAGAFDGTSRPYLTFTLLRQG